MGNTTCCKNKPELEIVESTFTQEYKIIDNNSNQIIKT